MKPADKDSFKNLNLLEIDKNISKQPDKILLNGESLTLAEILSVARSTPQVDFTTDPKVLQRIKICYQKMMEDVKNGVPIYGCNTGYGAQASRILINGHESERVNMAKKISEGIAHVDVSVGPVFESEVVRAAMLIRINMLMRGVSAVKIDDLDLYRQLLNAKITPIVNQYGGIGASGDLAHNARVLSALRQLDGVRVSNESGQIFEAKELLAKAGIKKLELDPKAGLGLVNGDNFSTALAALLAYDTLQLMILGSVVAAMFVEVLKGTDRSFHQLISAIRPHVGQTEASDIFRYLLNGSKLAYQEMRGHQKRPPGVRVQDGYSLRGLAQFYGVHFDNIKIILDTIVINANSVSDNPLWVSDEFVTEGEKPWQWVSGGNFLAMHMVDVLDSLRKMITHVVKINDRHLARLVSTNENNGLPPNLSDETAPTGCVFKGVQIQSGMFDVYSSLLSMPVSTFFGVHEEGNQDITSHALTSGILGLENLRLARYSLAQNLVALAQAVDLRGGGELLSGKTRPVYEFVRKRVRYVRHERPLNNDIETVYEAICKGDFAEILRSNVFAQYQSEP